MRKCSTVTISAPARLELTLIDLSLGSRRVNGSVGMAISQPSFECSVTRSHEIKVEGNAFEYAPEVTDFLSRLVEHIECDPVTVRVSSGIPPHRGFGSKTATLLAVGRATTTLYGKVLSTPSLAQLARRARTSGVGVNTFDRGGFLVDGGHPAEPNGKDPGDRFVPTRFSNRDYIPRVLFAGSFPWPILVIVPVGKFVEGQTELDHFRMICPIPRASVHEIAYITCFHMVAAVVEKDYISFCAAVNELQRTYLKAHELQLQSEQVRHVQSEALKHGIDAIGLTSNGPALYAFSQSPDVAETWLRELRRDGTILSFWWTSSPGSGATVNQECIEALQH